MSKEKEIRALKKEAEEVLDYLKELTEKRSGKLSGRIKELYDENLARGNKLLDQIEKLQKEERGNENMKKIETRSNGDIQFEQMLRGQVEVRDLQTTETGASVIPENVAGEIIKKMEETSPVFEMVRKFGSTSGTLRIAKENSLNDVTFIGEGSDAKDLKIDLTDVKLTQKRVGAALPISNQFIHDSEVDIASYAKDLLSRRLAKGLEKSILKGELEDEFRGIVGTDGIEEVSLPGAATYEIMADFHLKVNPDFLDGACYVMSRPFFNQVAKLTDGNKHFYLQMGNVNGKVQYTLQGFPVYVTDALDAGAAAGEVPVIFGNFKEAYGMMIKKDVGLTEVAKDTTNALRGSVLFVIDMYADGAVINEQALVKGVVA